VEGEDEPDAPDADSLSDIEGGPEIVSPGRR